MNLKNKVLVCTIIFLVLVSLSLGQANGPERYPRGFQKPVLAKGVKSNGTWKRRLQDVEKALNKIEKEINNPNSKLNKKLPVCIKASLGNLLKPYIEQLDILKGMEQEKPPTWDLKLKVILDKKYTNKNNKKQIVLAQLTGKNYVSAEGKSVNDGNPYTGVHSGTITLYDPLFGSKYRKCLEATIFHEILHLACFTRHDAPPLDYMGEKIAYGCTGQVYSNPKPKCLSTVNPDNGQDYINECTEANCEKEKKGKKDSYGKGTGFAKDVPDDNYSVADGVIRNYRNETNGLILRDGQFQALDSLMGGIYLTDMDAPEKLLKISKFLVIPSGAFGTHYQSKLFKHMLESYVAAGGTLVVLSQQYDKHVENLVPVPEGESLKYYGWRQDQSCYSRSVYFDSTHPVTSSCTNQLVTAKVDGYYSQWPSNADVLMYRTKNREAAMLHYPYGNGHVILTSCYTDFAAAHSQASRQELEIFRDLLTFAQDPSTPIPTFNLRHNNAPEVNLNIKIKNNTLKPAGMVKITVFSPDRKLIVYEEDRAIDLGADKELELPLQFTLNQSYKQPGIYHVDYELWDKDNFLLQLPRESTQGRFAIHLMNKEYTPSDGLYLWLTVDDEVAYFGDEVQFTLHAKNLHPEARTINIKSRVNHQEFQPLDSLTIPADTKISKGYTFTIPRTSAFRLTLEINDKLHLIKGLQMVREHRTHSTTNLPAANISPGKELQYNLEARHPSTRVDEGQYSIRTFIANKSTGSTEPPYQKVADVATISHNFKTSGTFKEAGSFPVTSTLKSDDYLLVTEIYSPDGTFESRYRSTFKVMEAPMEEKFGQLTSVSDGNVSGPRIAKCIAKRKHNRKVFFRTRHQNRRSDREDTKFCAIYFERYRISTQVASSGQLEIVRF